MAMRDKNVITLGSGKLYVAVWRRDAFIHHMSRTEEGTQYLDNAWRMEQTEPERAKLRRKLSKEGGAENGR